MEWKMDFPTPNAAVQGLRKASRGAVRSNPCGGWADLEQCGPAFARARCTPSHNARHWHHDSRSSAVTIPSHPSVTVVQCGEKLMSGCQYLSSSGGDLQLLAGVDPLTRLMMDADGVSMSEMETLIQQISRTLVMRQDSHSDLRE